MDQYDASDLKAALDEALNIPIDDARLDRVTLALARRGLSIVRIRARTIEPGDDEELATMLADIRRNVDDHSEEMRRRDPLADGRAP